jgi:hypothetical protein
MDESVEPAIAFRVRTRVEPALEVRVNFGLFAGRQATPAEIDDLAHALRDLVDAFAIVAEDRHEFGGDVEAALHQIVIDIAPNEVSPATDELAARVIAAAEAWAHACIAARHLELA